jgi:hypothetical protein
MTKVVVAMSMSLDGIADQGRGRGADAAEVCCVPARPEMLGEQRRLL